jgi:hypothetical protein
VSVAIFRRGKIQGGARLSAAEGRVGDHGGRRASLGKKKLPQLFLLPGKITFTLTQKKQNGF